MAGQEDADTTFQLALNQGLKHTNDADPRSAQMGTQEYKRLERESKEIGVGKKEVGSGNNCDGQAFLEERRETRNRS